MKSSDWASQAIQKLDAQKKGVTGRKEQAMAPVTLSALKDFCRQDSAFAQAVVQGGSFGECMTRIAAGAGNSISDLEVYKKAVQFYLPGSTIRMALTIELPGTTDVDPAPKENPAQVAAAPKPALTLNLADFF